MEIKTTKANSLLLTLAALVILIAGLKVAAPLLAQFLLALFIAVVCMPSIRWMEAKKVPRRFAIMIVLFTILAFVYLVIALVGDSVNAFNSNKEFYIQQLDSQLKAVVNWLVSVGIPVGDLQITAILEKADVMSLVTRVVGGVGVIFSDFFVIFLSVIFILAETTSFPKKFARAFSNTQTKMVHVNHVLSKIRHYLAGVDLSLTI
jgi:AI-2 transport protein TqsA